MGGRLDDIKFDNSFLDITPKARPMKAKIDKWNRDKYELFVHKNDKKK